MSLSVSLTKAKLKEKCMLLGLQPKKEYKEDSKDSYSYAIREYYLNSYYKGNIPKSLDLMLQLESPMAAAQLKTCKQDIQDKIWSSEEYFLEEKLDGVRQLLFFIDGDFKTYSRNLSDTDLLPIDYSTKIFHKCDFTQLKHSFILDSECVSMNPNISTIIGRRGVWTETQLQAVQALLSMNSEDSLRLQEEQNTPLKFYAFDCIYYDGQWLLDYPLVERRKYLKKALAELQALGFNIELPLSNISNKKAFYKKIISEGKEGCIAKYIYGTYHATTSRTHRQWIKLKRSMSETLTEEGAGDTIDGFITGYLKGSDGKAYSDMVGALQISCYLIDEFGRKKLHHIATISSFDLALRKEMTEYDEHNQPRLKEDFYNKVVEIDGQSVSSRNKRLRHAVLVRFRPDKTRDDCVIEEGFLNSMIL